MSRRQNRADLSLIHPLILITVIPVLTSSGYGYDSASSCDPNASRKGRSQLLQAIPCDLSIQAYCNLPGSAYPWHAVRRFVHENQGLMRRMYGDVRHISILQAEIDHNEIDSEDMHRTAERYSRMNTGRKMKPSSHYEYGRDKTNDVISEPHFRPTQKTSAVKMKTPQPPTAASTPNATTSSAKSTTTISATTSKPSFLSVTSSQSTTEIVEEFNQARNDTASMKKDQGDKIDMEKLSTIANLETSEDLNENTSYALRENDLKEGSGFDVEGPTKAPAPANLNESVENTTFSSSTTETATETTVDEKQTASTSSSSTTKKNEEMLFQDTAQKEPPVVNVRGVNACPVKEEVVAPFWANNTRGEVLALLNLYPFEQYVHWEKCSFEFKQMYCREGCRCEQQYRLHRLLAYDPHNECRGIFSDWFRFPSCCICKCYDLPYDYRVTSRSPRTIAKESIQFAEDELQNAIYDHATDEWYRP